MVSTSIGFAHEAPSDGSESHISADGVATVRVYGSGTLTISNGDGDGDGNFSLGMHKKIGGQVQ